MAIDYIADIYYIVNDCGVTITTATSGEVKAIYDNPYIALTDDLISVASSERILYCVSSDVTSLKVGDMVTIGNKNYKITHKEPDGTGLTILRVGER